MISEYEAAQAHFEESKGNRHNTTGLAPRQLRISMVFYVFSRMEQRDERYHHPVHRETELGRQKTQKKRHHQAGCPRLVY
jgi:hypothetical protein